MEIEIVFISPDYLKQVGKLAEKRYPDIKLGKGTKSDSKRLFRRLIRFQDIVLRSQSIMFKVSSPLFVYNDLKNKFSNITLSTFQLDISRIMFDIGDSFSDKHVAELSCLYKKVKSVLKSLLKEKIKDDSYLHYFLPMSVMVSYYINMNFLEVFEFRTRSESIILSEKTTELVDSIYGKLNQKIPELFSKQNLELFYSSKER